MSEKILLDTDIGNDIDDAVCLAYLLKQPKCDLAGITTVSGEPEKRAMMASAICKAANKDIPIYPGISEPILVPQVQPVALQATRLNNWDHQTRFPKGEAIEFMRQTIRKYPGEISLLAIGPLTNVAMLFAVDEEIPCLLKSLVLMCGNFTNAMIGEWNARCDPYAAAMVYNAPVKIHRSIGLNVTKQVYMNKEEASAYFKSDILKPVLDFAGVWFEERELLTYHDPLAAAVIFDDQICKFQKGFIEVELLSSRPRGKGATYWQHNEENGTKEAAMEVAPEKFFEHFFSVVNQ